MKRKGPRLAEVQHGTLLRVYGERPQSKCGDCHNLIAHTYGKTFYKCAKAHVSSSSASDWRVRWIACGLFKKREGELDEVIER